MKTPGEIKKGLETCCNNIECNVCPYTEPSSMCIRKLMGDALPYIQQLEERNDTLITKMAIFEEILKYAEQLKRERDAAIEQLKYFNCRTCVHSNLMHIASECCGCKNASRWEWRGEKEENR